MKADPGDFRRSMQPARGRERGEVWLRGNPRPMVATAFVAALAGGAGAAALAATPPLASAVGAASAVIVAACVAMAVAAGRPRIERRGDSLRLRVGPGLAHDVPLDVVECFFHGAHPLGKPVEPCTGEASEHEEHHDDRGRRRATLVVRIAERAKAWQRRATFPPWAGWNRGSVVIDGLWCEPLSMDRFGELAQKLVEAKRAAALKAAATSGEPR